MIGVNEATCTHSQLKRLNNSDLLTLVHSIIWRFAYVSGYVKLGFTDSQVNLDLDLQEKWL